MYDVCVIGAITKDRIQIPGRPDREMPGGSAYYVSRAWAALGLNVCVVTKVADADAPDLLSDLGSRGVHVVNRGSSTTTVFENRYDGPALQHRTQRVLEVAEPFEAKDVLGVPAATLLLGPLTKNELSRDVFEHVVHAAPRVALDAQGLLREVVDGEVRATPCEQLPEVLAPVQVLKVDDVEAEIMVGATDPAQAADRLADFGVDEVLVTFADRGSLVRVGGEHFQIPSVRAKETIDATGCGDTYVASYLFARLRGRSPEQAGRFAAAAASLKLSDYGPFSGSEEDVQAHLRRGGTA